VKKNLFYSTNICKHNQGSVCQTKAIKASEDKIIRTISVRNIPIGLHSLAIMMDNPIETKRIVQQNEDGLTAFYFFMGNKALMKS